MAHLRLCRGGALLAGADPERGSDHPRLHGRADRRGRRLSGALRDAIVYGFSLYVVGRGAVWQGRGALLKGAIMAAFGVGVLVEVALKISRGLVPTVELMSAVGVLALAANGSVLVVLWRRRLDDINMRSAWLCSRNDVVANAAVVLAAGGVALTGSAWPDILVGLGIAVLFGSSAVEVIRRARRELHAVSAG